MGDSARSRKTNARPTTEAKSGPRPIARMPGEGTLIPSGRQGADASKLKRKKTGGLSPRTRDVYRRDWQRFVQWCKTNRVQPLPARPETMIRYLDERAAENTRSVIYRELIVICRTHRAEGLRSPRQYPLVHKWLRAYRTEKDVPRAATAIQTAHFHSMIQRLYEVGRVESDLVTQKRKRLAAIRDRALFLFAKGAGMRRLEIRKLLVGDVAITKEGVVLTLNRSRLLGGTTTITLPRHESPAMCPVNAWQAWIKLAPAEADAPAFRELGGSGARDKPVGPTDVCIAVKRALHAVGVDPTPYTDDSLAAC